MRKEYRSALREEFTRRMKREFPQFAPVKIRAGTRSYSPGSIVFQWAARSDASCYIEIVPHHSGYPQFDVGLGWSRLGEFPTADAALGFRFLGQGEFVKPEFMITLFALIGKFDTPYYSIESVEEGWDHVWKQDFGPIPPEEARAKVRPVVEDAMAKLRGHGIPYLERFIEWIDEHPESRPA